MSARKGARAPRRPRLLGAGAHARAPATYGDPGMCRGLVPAPFSLRPWIARRSIPGQERPGPQRAGRVPAAPQLRARAGAGPSASVGRPLPPEGRRRRGARGWPAPHSRERHLQGIPCFRPLGRTSPCLVSRGPKGHLVLVTGSKTLCQLLGMVAAARLQLATRK